MAELEINIRIHGRRTRISKLDIEVLLAMRRESFEDLARRIPCARENLSRLLNGRARFPALRKKLTTTIEEMVEELPRQVARTFISSGQKAA
jgi:DNA-binding Xre family transcriptional regulator